VRDVGNREGADVAQLYLTEAAGEKDVRVLGFERVELHAGELRQVTVTADPRLLARFDAAAGRWRIAEGTYRIAVGKSAADYLLTAATSYPRGCLETEWMECEALPEMSRKSGT
jgi:beta-glucosidase